MVVVNSVQGQEISVVFGALIGVDCLNPGKMGVSPGSWNEQCWGVREGSGRSAESQMQPERLHCAPEQQHHINEVMEPGAGCWHEVLLCNSSLEREFCLFVSRSWLGNGSECWEVGVYCFCHLVPVLLCQLRKLPFNRKAIHVIVTAIRSDGFYRKGKRCWAFKGH